MPKLRHKITGISLLFLLLSLVTLGQQKDSATAAAPDTAKKVKVKHPYPNPKLSMLYSAILPGAGQFYNKRYWKIPIIYVGLGAMTYFIVWNQQQYNIFNSALKTRTNGGVDQFYNTYSSSDLVTIENYYSHYRNLSAIGAGFIYLLQIVDANVDAQFFHFDVSDNLSLRVTPLISSNPFSGYCGIEPGFSLVKRF